MSAVLRRGRPAASAALFTLLGACACPDCPPPERLPGRSFATPRATFEYLKDAVARTESDEAYAHHEFATFSERMKAERRITNADYFFVRDEALAALRERVGDLARVNLVGEPRYLDPNLAEITLSDGTRSAKATLVRETGFEVRFRDGRTAYGDLRAPGDALRFDDRGALLARLVSDDGRPLRPGATADDVYEVRYVSAWRFYSIDDTELIEDIRRRHDAKTRAAEAEKASATRPSG
ncbi:MAG TPA: hypothetical protein VEI02_05615 [Planctomycetota bacterium]|nr:hypothetical protein [Planctomycetota bacterium]